MLKKRLMTPGPTQVPEEALLEMAKQVTHHRTSEFKKTFEKVLAGLKVVFQTSGDVIVLTSSGSGAMEAAMVNTVPRGGKAIVLDAGRFAQRWAEIGKAFGIEVIRHQVPWGSPVPRSFPPPPVGWARHESMRCSHSTERTCSSCLAATSVAIRLASEQPARNSFACSRHGSSLNSSLHTNSRFTP